MTPPLSDGALDQLFRTARTYPAWLDIPVADELRRNHEDTKKNEEHENVL